METIKNKLLCKETADVFREGERVQIQGSRDIEDTRVDNRIQCS